MKKVLTIERERKENEERRLLLMTRNGHDAASIIPAYQSIQFRSYHPRPPARKTKLDFIIPAGGWNVRKTVP